MAATLVAVGGPASAHSQLIASTPGNGATLASHPATVTLTFNESINPAFVQVRVKDALGAGSDLAAQVAGPTVTATMIPLPAGTTTVLYRVTSADGHPISGEIRYTATSGATTPATATLTGTTAAPAGKTPTAATPDGAPASSATPWYVAGGGLALALLGVGVWGLRTPKKLRP